MADLRSLERGIDRDDVLFRGSAQARVKNGDILDLNSITSTSSNLETAEVFSEGRVMFEIHGSNGKRAVLANPVELETTLLPGHRLKVLATRNNVALDGYTVDQYAVVRILDPLPV